MLRDVRHSDTAKNTADNDDQFEDAQDWTVLKTTLSLYGPVFLILMLLFCRVRLRYPNVYKVRCVVSRLYNPLAENSHGFFEWIWKVLKISEDDISKHCSLDALCLLRILRLGLRLSCIGVMCSWFLVPIYASPDNQESLARSVGVDTDSVFSKTTSSNVTHGSHRLTGTIVAAYALFGSTMYLLHREFVWFIAQRTTFLTAQTARNYTVYVSGIPSRYQSNAELARFFRRVLSSPHAINSAAIVMHIPMLNAATLRQAALQRQLERSKVLYERMCRQRRDDKEEQPMVTIVRHDSSRGLLERVPAMEYYTEQLERLALQVDHLRTLIDCKQRASDAGILEDVMKQAESVHRETADTQFIGIESNVVGPAVDGVADNNKESIISDAMIENEIIVERDLHDKDNPLVECEGVNADALDGPLESESLVDEGQNTMEATERGLVTRGITDLAVKIARTIGFLGGDDNEGKPLSVGFVTFTKLSAVTVALQLIHSPVPFEMEVVAAPAPEDILWSNVGLRNRDLQMGKLLSYAITVTICIFWTVPVTFLVSLTELNALKEQFVFLQQWLESAPWLDSVLSQASPLLLTFLNTVLLPFILRRVSQLEGMLGVSHLETSLYSKLAIFQILQTLVITSIAGSVTSALSQIDGAVDIFRHLASALPPQTVFLMQLIVISTVIGLGSELLRTTAILQSLSRCRLGPRLTERDRDTPFLGLRPLSNPRNFLHAQVLANVTLYFAILFTFVVLSPSISYALLLAFASLEVGYRHQFIYIYPPTPDSGGLMWISFVKLLLLYVPLAELTLLSYMALANARREFAMMVPLILVTVLFHAYIRQKHFDIARHLASATCVDHDAKQRSATFDFLENKYLQPALLPPEDRVDLNTREMSFGRLDGVERK